MKISEMVVGQNIECRLMLASATVRQTKGRPPRPFLAATLADGTDTIDCVMWSYNNPDGAPETGKVYDIAGNVTEYNGKKQLTMTAITLSADQDITEFNCTYEEDLGAVWSALENRIRLIDHPMLQTVTSFIYRRYKDEILHATSAKGVHHVGIGGNACHTIEVFDYARSIALSAQKYGLEVDLDLVLAGALLHDIGKVFTYKIDGAVVDYTLEGRLHDHIYVGARMVEQAATQNGLAYDMSLELLSHIILSHHGQLELGSPVTPKFAEAYIVNMADGISARLDTLKAANAKAVADNKPYTDRLFTLGNYAHILQGDVRKWLHPVK